jgi:predicted ester cyclase
MTTEQNKALVRRFYEAFGANDQAVCAELLAPDLVAYSHGAPGPQNRATHLQGIRMWNTAFRDTHFTIEEQIAEGDKVATRVILRAIHSGGEFQGLPPTGKQIELSGTSIEQIKDGKILKRHVDSDFLGMMRQLGLISSPQAVSE